MSRIFWDTMMLVYFLEGHEEFGPQVRASLTRSHARGDALFTSYLALGELMAGAHAEKAAWLGTTIGRMGFSFLSFDGKCTTPFAKLRSEMRLKAPDSIHLACAAAAGVDLYLTGDRQLLQRRLYVPGIQFIAHFGAGML
jgi:predicted nucleic acid-binding protein